MADYEIDDYLDRHVPLARFMGIHVQTLDNHHLALAAPLEPNTNDKGSAFAGALAAIITLAGWAVCYLTLREQNASAELVIANSEIRYLKPVREEIIATCTRPDVATVEQFITTLNKRGKASWELTSNIRSGAETAVSFRGRYAAFQST